MILTETPKMQQIWVKHVKDLLNNGLETNDTCILVYFGGVYKKLQTSVVVELSGRNYWTTQWYTFRTRCIFVSLGVLLFVEIKGRLTSSQYGVPPPRPPVLVSTGSGDPCIWISQDIPSVVIGSLGASPGQWEHGTIPPWFCFFPIEFWFIILTQRFKRGLIW